MRRVIAFDVGDGACIRLITLSDRLLHIDCGSQDGAEMAYDRLLTSEHLLWAPQAFVLSHFHADHYNGLLFASLKGKPFPFWRNTEVDVYYPRIPEFTDRQVFLQCLFAMNARVFGSETGVMEYDFRRAMRTLAGPKCRFQAVSKGDTIRLGSSFFKVLWPPSVVDSAVSIKAIRTAIADFEKARTEDEETSRILNEIKKEDFVNNLLEGQTEDYSNQIHHEESSIHLERQSLPAVVLKANDSLRQAANHLCISFFEDNRLLFLGDLESYEIDRVVSELIAEGRSYFLVVSAAHHGTHWHDTLRKIRSSYCIASNGKKLFKKIEPDYKHISDHYLSTFASGDIVVPFYPPRRIGLWEDRLWY